MCIRTVFWEDSRNDIPKKSAGSFTAPVDNAHREESLALLTAPNSCSLPLVLYNILDFMKGISGISYHNKPCP